MLLLSSLLGCGAPDTSAADDRHAIQAAAFRAVLEERGSDATTCADVRELPVETAGDAIACEDVAGDLAALLAALADEAVVARTECTVEPDSAEDTCAGGLLDPDGAPAQAISVGCPVGKDDGTYEIGVVWFLCDLSTEGRVCTVRPGVAGWVVDECVLAFAG